MEKLKSSFKNLQGAITSIKPIGPICLLETKTQSFGEGDLPRCTSSTSSSTSFGHDNSYQLPLLEEDFFSTNAAAMPSSSPSAGQDEGWSALLQGPISSKRFFFSPRTTKSIMEEAKAQPTGKAAPGEVAFYEESIMVTISSPDPYLDFRASMEEMVAAHALREWHSLQELLHCYLRLNERKNHKVIVLAFVDLLMHLMDQDHEVSSQSSSSQ